MPEFFVTYFREQRITRNITADTEDEAVSIMEEIINSKDFDLNAEDESDDPGEIFVKRKTSSTPTMEVEMNREDVFQAIIGNLELNEGKHNDEPRAN